MCRCDMDRPLEKIQCNTCSFVCYQIQGELHEKCPKCEGVLLKVKEGEE